MVAFLGDDSFWPPRAKLVKATIAIYWRVPITLQLFGKSRDSQALVALSKWSLLDKLYPICQFFLVEWVGSTLSGWRRQDTLLTCEAF